MIVSQPDDFIDRTFALDALLELAQTLAGSTDVSDARIKFQQCDDYPAPDDGREYDNIRITTGIAPQTTPYVQDFSAGLPGATQGWEYYSDNDGRMQVIGGRLRMDDSGPGDPWSLNEAILRMNLTGKSNVQLTFDHVNVGDENMGLPASFTGHYNGDGVALSVDGVHWIAVTSLTDSFTDRTFALDALLNQAKTAAGSTDVSNVRIKFQQHDNYPAPDDGREFDNIRVTAGLTPQTTPYTQNFTAGQPNASQGWEYYWLHLSKPHRGPWRPAADG